MIEERLSLWEKNRIQDCGRYWYPERKKATIKDLADAFGSMDRVRTVLRELNPHTASLLATLLDTTETLTRGQLAPARGAQKERLRESVQELETRALVFVMKNRMKLDDGLDRLVVNPRIRELLAAPGGFIGIARFSTASLSLDTCMRADAVTEGQMLGGMAPAWDDCADVRKQGILFVDGGFTDGFVPEADGPDQGGVQTIRLTAVLIVSQLLSFLRKRTVHLSDQEVIRVRDLAILCGESGVSTDELVEYLFWGKECGLVLFRHGRCNLSPEGTAFLRMSVEERREVLLSSLSPLSQNGEESIGQLFAKWLKVRKIKTGENSRNDLGNFRKFIIEYRRRWLAGSLEAVCNRGRIAALRTINDELLFKPLSGSILITGGLEVHIVGNKIAPLQILFLNAFGISEEQKGIRFVRFTEESVRRGLLLGFSGKRFLELLAAGCDREPPQSFLFTLQDWVNSFQVISSGEALLLQASDSVRELFLHDRELSIFYIASLDNGMIAVRGGNRQQLFTLLEKRHILLHFIGDEDD